MGSAVQGRRSSARARSRIVLSGPDGRALEPRCLMVAGSLQFAMDAFTVAENAGEAVITVTRTGGTDPVTVEYTANASGASATAGSDFTPVSGTLSFAADETSKTFIVPILDDTIVEPGETVSLALSNPSADGTLGTPNQANLTITDVEAGQFTLDTPSVSVLETAGQVVLTVQRTQGLDGAVSVTYATSNNSAIAGVNYTATAGTLDFAAGESSKTVTVPILNDNTATGDRIFLFSLSAPTAGTRLGSPSSAFVTIQDVAPGTLQFGLATFNATENQANGTITVTRTNGSTGIVSINFATIDGGTAVAGTDYTPTSGTLTFNPAETSKTFNIPLLDDRVADGNRTVLVQLTSPSGGAVLGTPSQTTLSINDFEEGEFRLSDSSYVVAESGGSATIVVNRIGGGDGTTTVQYATSNGTAIAGTDYTNTTGTLSFAPGEVTKSFSVPILDNNVANVNKTFNVTLSQPTGNALLVEPSTATVTINDFEAGELAFTTTTASVNEKAGRLNLTVSRTKGSLGVVTVKFATSNGTAIAGQDYDAQSGTLTFQNGETSKSITLTVADDSVTEPSETFRVTLSDPTDGAILGANSAVTVTILDGSTTASPTVYIDRLVTRDRLIIGAVLQFSTSMALSPVTDSANFEATASGRDGRFGTRDDITLVIKNLSYSDSTRTVNLEFTSDLGTSNKILVVAKATPVVGLSDSSGNVLDGDRDGVSGGDFAGKAQIGVSLRFPDRDKDHVAFRQSGSGYLEVSRDANGEARQLRVLGAIKGRGVLTGDVVRGRRTSDGKAVVHNITGATDSKIRFSRREFLIGEPPSFPSVARASSRTRA